MHRVAAAAFSLKLAILSIFGAAAQTKHILPRLDAVLARAGYARGDVRDLLVYVTDDEAAKDAIAVCRAAFDDGTVAMSPVRVGLAVAGARVEIMTFADRG